MKYFIVLVSVFFSINILNSQELVYDINGNEYATVTIENKIWITSNLNVSKYKNGEPIIHAKTKEEWVECAKKKIGCWCYYENDSLNSFANNRTVTTVVQEPNSFGKLYNWYALNDPRGFGIEGFKIPKIEDWSSLTKYGSKALKSKTGWMILTDVTYTGCQCKGYNCNGNNSIGLNIKGSGYRNYIGIWEEYASFYEDYERAIFWVDFKSENSIKEITINGEKIIIETGANVFGIDGFEDNYWGINSDVTTPKGDGYSVRLIKEISL